ncbi:lipocalin family protein [Paenibacillus sp. y28]|uniref:lipocalin family protein n=1 Tax=Paenibacillus sp. y28 TaxID=3129110 RepID=UPI003018CDCF
MSHDRSLISFPQAAADRPASNLEWWYCYAFLTGSAGRRYAVMVSFFRVGELPVHKGHYLISSFTCLDERKVQARSYLDRRLIHQLKGFYFPAYFLLNPGDRSMWKQYSTLLAGSLPSPHLRMGPSSVQAKPPRLIYGNYEWTFPHEEKPDFDLLIQERSARLHLNFTPVKPASLIDEHGTINGFRYASLTRNQVTGELQTPDGLQTVSGEGWFDRQWGRNYGLLLGTGWDWFGLQLKDGRDLLISRLHPANSELPEEPVAKLIHTNGEIVTVGRVGLQPLRYWKSLYTGMKYPVEWQVDLPDLSISLHVAPLLNQQEMPIIGPLRAIWEGACTVTGESRGPQAARVRIRGKGFMELVGYTEGSA